MKRHCIVTPDLIGPIKNGGIGTHCHWLARLLAEADREVTILFTGPVLHGDVRHWQSVYRDLKINLLTLEDHPQRDYPVRALPLQQRSYDVYRFLMSHDFDVIHFQDWQGNGLQTLQARRTLGHLASSCVTVTLHSNTKWIAEGGRHWYRRPIDDAMTYWAEAFTAQNADMVFSPSQYMLDWVGNDGWEISTKARVIPVCTGVAQTTIMLPVEPGVIAFFGRLESRKGLDLFLRALALLPPAVRAKLKKVHFVGKIGRVGAIPAHSVIRDAFTRLGLAFEVHSEFDSGSAVDFLKSHRPTIFVPSLADNYPLSIIEAASLGLPIYASNVGGIPEILGDGHLFDPSPSALALKISEALEGVRFVTDFRYDATKVRQAWLSALSACEAEGLRKPPIGTGPTPKISICVPYYNYPDYLPKLLDSLGASTYTNFEVIVIDDGSPQSRAREAFDAIATGQYAFPARFERQANSGVGATRNSAAALAVGDYLVFMDADNLAKPDMLSVFVEAMARTDADILTCYFDAFEQHREPIDDSDIHHVYAPSGPALEVGWAENVFGDANFCVKKSVFEELGGFGTERDSSWEDWEFLVRARLAGKDIDVIPKSLFWYRYTDEGFSRNTDPYLNQRRLLRTFCTAAGPEMGRVIETMRQVALAGRGPRVRTPAGIIAGEIADRIYTRLGSPTGRLAQALEKFFKKFTN